MVANNMLELLNILWAKNFMYGIVDGEFSMILGNQVPTFKIDDEEAIADLIQQLQEW